jgi:serine/threonine-protein kinase
MSDILPPPIPGPAAPPQGEPGAAPRPDQDGLPRRFGKYTLIRKLAQGGMAELFLAIQKSVAGFEKLIVIKRILPSMNQDKAFIDMLLHEARIAATLSHQNIVQIFDVGSYDGLYFIAMEHVHGEDIRSIVRQMKKKGVTEFPLEHAIAIILGMCAGLAYAHEKGDLDGTALGIVHRDISPQNIVVTFTGEVKIVDFGIAKSDSKMAGDTKSGKLKGKVPYMSPEQARGENIDARSDIFATGVMLFELTTGKRLFKGASEYETLKLICEREYPRPSQVRPGYPPDLERIVMKALEKDRNARYQSAREMQADLEEFVRNHRIPVSTIALTQFMQSLFEDMLASQKEALLQGKQLADIIELQESRESQVSLTNTGSNALSMPAASHTLAGVDAPQRSSAGWIVAGVLAVLVIGGGTGGFVYWQKQKAAALAMQQQQQQQQLPEAPKGSIEISSDPPGAAIWLDGNLQAEVTPAKIGQLPLDHPMDVKLTKDGFEAVKQSVTLTEREPEAKVTAKLQKGSVVVTLSVLPAAAKPVVLLDGKKQEGLTLEGISSGEQHKLVVSAPGYQDYATTFLGAPQERKHFDVTLQKAVALPPGGKPHVDTTPRGSGKLNVSASGGWCNISVDGAPKGPTPLAGIELPAGTHKVVCTPEGKPPVTATVTVPVDGVARHKFTL